MGNFKESIKKIVSGTDPIESDFIENLAQNIINYVKSCIEKSASLEAFKYIGDLRIISGCCSLKHLTNNLNGKIIVNRVGRRSGRAPYVVPESAEYSIQVSNRYFHRISVSYNDISREINITRQERRLRARLDELAALNEIKIKGFLLITYTNDTDTEDCYQEIFEDENITVIPPNGFNISIGIIYKYEFEF